MREYEIVLLVQRVFVCVWFSRSISLTSYVLNKLCCKQTHLLAAHQDHFSFSVLIPLCLSSLQADSHRSSAQMPWPTMHVCMNVCVNKCVCAHLLLALSRTASQCATTLPHSLLLSHHSSPSLSSNFQMKSMKRVLQVPSLHVPS